MRALIRGKEVCLENAWSKWQKMNMLFLTGKEKDADGNPLPGDGWTLVEDYQEPVEGTEESQPVQCTRSSESEGAVTESPSTPAEEKPVEQRAESLPETVTYGGKEYTLDELKKLIG